MGDTTKTAMVMTTAPQRPRGHGSAARGLDAVARAPEGFGRFGRMFPELPPARFGINLEQDREIMIAIGKAMIKDDPGAMITEAEPLDENAEIPAGYTYLGQFIDHDITFDTSSSLDRAVDPSAVQDFRTPRLDLDSLYGRGPDDQPYLYNEDMTMKLGRPVSPPGVPKRFDLPRAELDKSGETTALGCQRAIIGDKRNDENSIVNQLHSLFLRFHNAVLADMPPELGGGDAMTRFRIAQLRVRWHYQWIVLYDFVRRIVGKATFDAVFPYDKDLKRRVPSLLFYVPDDARYPYMPVEFSVAAYRFGHSMVRPSYSLSTFIPHEVAGGPGKLSLDRLPIFTGKFSCDGLDSLNGFRPIPDAWGIDWAFYFGGLPKPTDPKFKDFKLPQPSYRMDSLLSLPLADLPDHQKERLKSLPQLNLVRGTALGLPSGQAVARRMGLEPLTDDQLWLVDGNLDADPAPADRKAVYEANKGVLANNAPLWYYILREAELTDVRTIEVEVDDPANPGKKIKKQKPLGGWHLGPVGGRIVAEVLIGLIARDEQSFLVQAPLWKPQYLKEGLDPESFSMADIIRFVDGLPMRAA